MIGDGPQSGFMVSPRSIFDIRAAADSVRAILGVGDEPQSINFGRFLDMLNVKYGITYDVVEDEDMPLPSIEACWVPEIGTMYIRDDVFAKVCAGDGRAKFTVIHEFGHAILGHRRTLNRATATAPTKQYQDSEWQANQFAAEFLMPLSVIQKLKLKTSWDVEWQFNVSALAAETRVSKLTRRGELSC